MWFGEPHRSAGERITCRTERVGTTELHRAIVWTVNAKEMFHINFVMLLNNKISTMLHEKQEHKSLSTKQVSWLTAKLHVSASAYFCKKIIYKKILRNLQELKMEYLDMDWYSYFRNYPQSSHKE